MNTYMLGNVFLLFAAFTLFLWLGIKFKKGEQLVDKMLSYLFIIIACILLALITIDVFLYIDVFYGEKQEIQW